MRAIERSKRPVGRWVAAMLRVIPLLVGATFSPARAGAQAWVPTDIGAAAGVISSTATAVNDGGQVVGSFITAEGQTHAFSWTPTSGFADLGTLGGESATAMAVNSAGEVVGVATNAAGQTRAFKWTSAGGMVDLGTLGGSVASALGINAAGTVVGVSNDSGNVAFHPFMWTPDTGMVDLGTLGGTTGYAKDINDSGQVVGYSYLPGTDPLAYHAFSWTGGALSDLGTLGGTSSVATSVNARGQIVGDSRLSGNLGPHAFSRMPGDPMVDLGTLGGSRSFASGVNDSGQLSGVDNESRQIVGTSDLPGDTVSHAFVRTAAGRMVDLGVAAGGTLSSAASINNAGQVVGTR